jgi:hypothetical protein
VSRDVRYNNRLEVVWEYYSPFQPSIQGVYLSLCTCIGTKRDCPGKYMNYFKLFCFLHNSI